MAAIGAGLLRALEILVYMGLGLVTAWLTWDEVELRWTLEHHGEVVNAEIVDLSAGRGRSSTTWRPILRFITVDGQQLRATARGAGDSNPGIWERGGITEVVYDPASPTRVMEVEELDRVGWILALLPGLAFAILVCGFATARAMMWLRRAKR